MHWIPEREVSFHPHSYGDPAGRLFWWNGQLYRGIRSEWAPFFTQLFRDGVIQKLVDGGLLIESEITPLVLDGYGLVVRHRCVPFVSYPHEWCAAMFKEAAFTYIKLARELVRRGLILKDTHPWNLLFEGCKPVYVDLTSIRAITDDSKYPPYDKFCRYYLYPLLLMSHGQERIARCLLPEYEGILKSDLLLLTQGTTPLMSRLTVDLWQRVPEPCRSLLNRALRPLQWLFRKQSSGPNSQLDFLEKIRREVESIRLPSAKTELLDDDRNSIPGLSSQGTSTTKQLDLHKILTDLRPGSLLAIGSNTGWCSRLAALVGSRVVSFDTDSTNITQLYYDARDKNLPILPLIMDFTDLTPSRGLSSHLSIAATERFQCDMVVALALVNHVVSRRQLNFNQIVGGLALFSKRWLVVDFIPMHGRQSDGFSWYTLDNFISTLKERFRSVSIMPSHPETCVLLLCEK